MCSCSKKKHVEATPATSIDPIMMVKVQVTEETYYMSDVLKAPVILRNDRPNLVYKQDLKILKYNHIQYMVV